MTRQLTVEELIRKIEDVGLEPRSYSGRGMHGVFCVGCALDDDEELPTPLHQVPGVCVDSLGRGRIAYWPRILAPQEME